MDAEGFGAYDVVITTYGNHNSQTTTRCICTNAITRDAINRIFTPWFDNSTCYSSETRVRKRPDMFTLANRYRLFSISWRRIILDEGHGIRNPQTKAALAATALLGESRWVLTGLYFSSYY